MNIYDKVALGQISKATAEKILANSGQKYSYSPTLPQFTGKPEPLIAGIHTNLILLIALPILFYFIVWRK